MNNKKSIVALLVVTIICGGAYLLKNNGNETILQPKEAVISQEYSYKIEESNKVEEVIEIIQETNESELKQYKVYVCGAVNEVKVVTLNEGSRVIDALDLAGGVTDEADLNKINLASFIEDAQKIYIPKIGEEVDKIEFTAQNSNVDNINIVKDNDSSDKGIININTASKSELQTLPGIGETIAEHIIDYRTENGGFKSIDDIKNVTRIGEKTFEKLKDKIKISN